jgi:hypothetical protein
LTQQAQHDLAVATVLLTNFRRGHVMSEVLVREFCSEFRAFSLGQATAWGGVRHS